MSEAWRYCGNQVKLWRTRAGVSREQLVKEVESARFIEKLAEEL
ncbi:hypothetical protein OG709_22155 [Streptomyces sp. NBC_01267]|nr:MULTISPECIES: hypothetical protein [unclassified Streptomyces]MCX4548789.1 hypothetical protein [Streptomyces sp. NBC_01500]WSC20374.1 hypothetical protein OIE60_12145 [Streptomyces sp. NBC_01766]